MKKIKCDPKLTECGTEHVCYFDPYEPVMCCWFNGLTTIVTICDYCHRESRQSPCKNCLDRSNRHKEALAKINESKLDKYEVKDRLHIVNSMIYEFLIDNPAINDANKKLLEEAQSILSKVANSII